MKARDFRIGNIIHDPDKGADGYTYVTARIINALDAHPKSCNHSPIPLTEEWLVRLGFESGSRDRFNWYFTKQADGKNMIAVNLSPMSTPHFGWQYYAGSLPKDMCQHIRVEYVHQLQNLYYVLTEEELEIVNR